MHTRILILIVGLFYTCGLTFGYSQDTPKYRILASASMWADMAKNLAGDKAIVDVIVPIGGDPHLYEPTPGDAKKVSNADLILVNGLTFEGWINELIAGSGTDAKTVVITNEVQPIRSDIYKDATDPHAWMNAANGLLYIKAIHEAIIAHDPANVDYYKGLYEAYRDLIEGLDNYIKFAVKKVPEQQRVLITSHDAFKYYGQAYGLKLEAIQGISTESEAQTSDMIRVTDAITKYQVPAVFIESTINPKMLKQIAKDNGVKIGGQLYADSLGEEGSPGDTYIGMMTYNTDVIVNALSNANTTDIKFGDETTDSYLYLILGLVLLGIMGLVFLKLNK